MLQSKMLIDPPRNFKNASFTVGVKGFEAINCFILLPMIGTHWAKFYFVQLFKPTKCQLVNWIGGEQSLEFFSCPQNCRGMKVPNSI